MPHSDWINMCKGDLAFLGADSEPPMVEQSSLWISRKNSQLSMLAKRCQLYLARGIHRYKMYFYLQERVTHRSPQLHMIRRYVRFANPVQGCCWNQRNFLICSLPALSCLQPMTSSALTDFWRVYM